MGLLFLGSGTPTFWLGLLLFIKRESRTPTFKILVRTLQSWAEVCFLWTLNPGSHDSKSGALTVQPEYCRIQQNTREQVFKVCSHEKQNSPKGTMYWATKASRACSSTSSHLCLVFIITGLHTHDLGLRFCWRGSLQYHFFLSLKQGNNFLVNF